MSIDETRGHVKATDIGHGTGLCGIDRGAHRGDLSVGDRDVHDGVQLVARIDDVSAFEQELIANLRAGIRNGEKDHEQNRPESARRVGHV